MNEATLNAPGKQGLLWHRYAKIGSDMDLVGAVRDLTEMAVEHGHEFLVMQSFHDAVNEAERARRRSVTVRDSKATSFVAAGLKERHLYIPIMAIGMFEGEVFRIFDIGAQAGVRLIFVGPQERFDMMPFRMVDGIDTSGNLCGCTGGF